MPYLAVMASVESLHRMTRDERDLGGLVVSGSDHLTAYNVYADAFSRAGARTKAGAASAVVAAISRVRRCMAAGVGKCGSAVVPILARRFEPRTRAGPA